jgi:hypothetical protein
MEMAPGHKVPTPTLVGRGLTERVIPCYAPFFFSSC